MGLGGELQDRQRRLHHFLFRQPDPNFLRTNRHSEYGATCPAGGFHVRCTRTSRSAAARVAGIGPPRWVASDSEGRAKSGSSHSVLRPSAMPQSRPGRSVAESGVCVRVVDQFYYVMSRMSRRRSPASEHTAQRRETGPCDVRRFHTASSAPAVVGVTDRCGCVPP